MDETYELRFLTGAIVEAAGDAEVARAWEAIRHRRNNPDWWRVVSFLAKRPTAPESLIDEIVDSLNAGALHPSEIEYMSRIRHRKIVEWFRERQDSKDPALAKLARKVAGKTPAPPEGVTLAGGEPSREGEVESCEIDVDKMPNILREYRKAWALQMPRWLSTQKALDFLPVDKWARVDLKSKVGGPYSLWLRLEDVDVVELVLTRELEDPGG